MQNEFVPQDQAVNKKYYLVVLKYSNQTIRYKRVEIFEEQFKGFAVTIRQ